MMEDAFERESLDDEAEREKPAMDESTSTDAQHVASPAMAVVEVDALVASDDAHGVDDVALQRAKRDLCEPQRHELEQTFQFLTRAERRTAYGDLAALAQRYADALQQAHHDELLSAIARDFTERLTEWRKRADARRAPFALPPQLEDWLEAHDATERRIS